ncbi:ATP-binding protein [Streptomyces goshikiensis]|uniref:ATP-binding protein n=1 Tax=Streptomyces goshikiensis TaxID=1942 RepID=UPI0037B04670
MTANSVQPAPTAADHGEAPLQAARPQHRVPREVDAILLCFRTAARGAHEQPPAEDLLRVEEARRTVRQRMEHCGLTDLAHDVVLIVSELLTNAILHGQHGSEVSLRVGLRDGLLMIIVTDGARAPRSARPADRNDTEHGRGLLIVNGIAEERHGRWGATSDQTGTWCELPVAGIRSAA